MKPQLILITHVENRAVTEGFVPAALNMGYDVFLLTDHGLAHKQYFAGKQASPTQIIECDVFNPMAIIDLLHTLAISPAVIFSNSDHLQASTAIVADYFFCPAKDWHLCYQAKNKAAMRTRLTNQNQPNVWTHTWLAGQPLPKNLPFPLVAKPREGVASLNVAFCDDLNALIKYASAMEQTDTCILLEAYLEGPLFTLETLGDGEHIQAIGGFDVSLSALPHFVETQASWNGPVSLKYREQALAQVAAFGVNFGVCHSEFILTDQGPVLVEINYRSIGDGREFLLDKLLPFSWFETILSLHSGKPLAPLKLSSSEAIIRYFPSGKAGEVQLSPAPFEYLNGEQNISFIPIKTQGDSVKLTHSNKDYLGALTLIGPDRQVLSAKADELSRELLWELN
ncbi:ATP-grasp domain [Shewanella psychrophila]|uniref:ATP-grasp domain n=1 Tax=Shewanella psychrophila TaxID=225848 RepID=A0A1S6HYS9_9GAMM|nr:carboxylate--amine ligase [Shewanella psychrophila]AQS40659.1 ATP-grasp domain [Shewanella psychrophila]